MSYHTSIEWTDSTWNPVIGCIKVSPGCKNCYAEAITKRFEGVKGHPFELGFQVRLRPDKLDEPSHWKKPRKIFTCSMSDLFQDQVPNEFIEQVFEVMKTETRHTFQILTKRPDRLTELSSKLLWASNIWVGVSVETEEQIDRISFLKTIPAAVRFVSFEPLLGPISNINLGGIDWIIAGGESGVHAREMDTKWALGIRDQCIKWNIPFFFKQYGGKRDKKGGMSATLDGVAWKEFPIPKLDRQSISG
jgi:protein gp37